MERLLGDEYPAFLHSYGQPRQQGLRVNTLKIGADRFASISPFPLEPVPWIREGFYTPDGERPGKHPYYHAGLYYIQEPSAMAPVELLDVKPGEYVLDLCAAPGGKTTQIAAKLQGEGLLVANDNQPDRVKALAKNIELLGSTNVVVLNETPERLAPVLTGFFDKILVDAPCSGEGMFRKDEQMAKTWDEQAPGRYAAMQRAILARAAEMLAPGGRLVYSTCTFSPLENEQVVADFLAERPDFRVVPVPLRHGFRPGRPDWVAGVGGACADSLAGAVRLWPHHVRGEGHFAVLLERAGELRPASERMPVRMEQTGPKFGGKNGNGRAGRKERDRRSQAADLSDLHRFVSDHLTVGIRGTVAAEGDFVYAIPPGTPLLEGLRKVRSGWFIGTLKNGRFVPSHALAMGLRRDTDAVRSVSMDPDADETIRYLKGETIPLPEERIRRCGRDVPAKGYCLVTVAGFPLGWGKWLDGMLKNEYPPGWRWV